MLNKKRAECIKLMVEGDLTQRQIADVLKVSEQTICSWKKDEEFSDALDAAQRQYMSLGINRIAPKALRKIEKLIESSDDQVALSACKDLLDRAGYKAMDALKITSSAPVQIINDIPRVDEYEAD